MATDVTLPALGEGVERATVVRVLVAPGDRVATDQPLLEVETDKATVEVPAPAAGTVRAVGVEAGATIGVGERILTLEPDGAPAPPDRTVPAPAPAATGDRRVSVPDTARRPGTRALAAPSVRKLAREIGVNVDEVAGSGRGGRIGLDDVKAHARRRLTRIEADPAASAPPLPDFARWGSVERLPLTGVRRVVARRMSVAWQTVPHVTQHDQADISEIEAVRSTVKRTSTHQPPTVTAFAVAIAAAALKEFPRFNASIDMARNEIIYKRYVNIGVAVDTERGLLVPVIRDADRKSLGALSSEIAALADKVRTTGASVEDLEGGTFTVTNLGGLGGTSFTPIVNSPEVAILGLSRTAPAPVYVNDRFEARPMLPLSLSYDHRLIDGADGVRFLRWIATRLEHPLLLEL